MHSVELEWAALAVVASVELEWAALAVVASVELEWAALAVVASVELEWAAQDNRNIYPACIKFSLQRLLFGNGYERFLPQTS